MKFLLTIALLLSLNLIYGANQLRMTEEELEQRLNIVEGDQQQLLQDFGAAKERLDNLGKSIEQIKQELEELVGMLKINMEVAKQSK